MCVEYDNMLIVQDYFMSMFLKKLLTHLNAPAYMFDNFQNKVNNKSFILKIIELIKVYGIESYIYFVNNYNKELQQEQQNGTLITPAEIVEVLPKKHR